MKVKCRSSGERERERDSVLWNKYISTQSDFASCYLCGLDYLDNFGIVSSSIKWDNNIFLSTTKTILRMKGVLANL